MSEYLVVEIDDGTGDEVITCVQGLRYVKNADYAPSLDWYIGQLERELEKIRELHGEMFKGKQEDGR